eukprot:c6359_g1_i2.p1 GENE.c6359_g1_i2~~c6359_g1_i2.p1  ORF type:complete len:106 (+),score=27.19 c6359_g1_i2:178-495(+)
MHMNLFSFSQSITLVIQSAFDDSDMTDELRELQRSLKGAADKPHIHFDFPEFHSASNSGLDTQHGKRKSVNISSMATTFQAIHAKLAKAQQGVGRVRAALEDSNG